MRALFSLTCLAMLGVGCFDDGGECPPPATYTVDSGSYVGETLSLEPREVTIEVDRENNTLTETFTNASGQTVVRSWEIESSKIY